MWTQFVGKVRLKLCPLVNHWWNVTLYVTGRGLTTLAMPYQDREVEMRFDFVDHKLILETSDGRTRVVDLKPQSVAEFYTEFMAALADLGLDVKIWTTPVEIPEPIPFEQDHTHASYDAEAVHRFWLILTWADEVFKEFRARFIGKVSPVQFWWGSFDHAVTRFSGRVRRSGRAPIASPARRILTRSAAPGSGPVAATSRGRPSTPTPRLSRPVLPGSVSDRQRLSTILR